MSRHAQTRKEYILTQVITDKELTTQVALADELGMGGKHPEDRQEPVIASDATKSETFVQASAQVQTSRDPSEVISTPPIIFT